MTGAPGLAVEGHGEPTRKKWVWSGACAPHPAPPRVTGDHLPGATELVGGFSSIFSFRKSDPAEAEARCLRLSRQHPGKVAGGH